MEESKPMLRLKRTLTKGNLWLYILSELKRGRVYAYGLSKKIEKEFGWSHGLITSYVVLYKLENEGLISSEFEGRRKYYKITKKGSEELRKAKRYLQQLLNKL
ncbi:MAG: Transcriptional regulator, PadR family [Candidatus Fermentimicrarchaeum limneticum]|uniref:Transcriptional regulator, PadR family n=1 Tax=Fermentimicrarchaeum limneticum TaxID=2795018 RepID=A0A7D6BPE4_FERL1|nr:MAG: Transcriptional regulator, PadR family [Candidatus Fermentimicrarchaeum limneticum]